MSKYGNKKTVVDNITFASRKEARRYEELRLLEQAGEIWALRWQVKIPLHTVDPTTMEMVKVCDYICDYVYKEKGETRDTFEDVKGMRTQVYLLKKRWLKLEYDFDILET